MILEDQDEEERTCIICNKPDCRFTLMLWHYYNQDQSVSENEVWLCDFCQHVMNQALDYTIRELIKEHEVDPEAFKNRRIEKSVRHRRAQLLLHELKERRQALRERAYDEFTDPDQIKKNWEWDLKNMQKELMKIWNTDQEFRGYVHKLSSAEMEKLK